MEQDMPEPTAAAEAAPPPATDDEHAIRQRVRELTSQVLQQGRVDTEALRQVVRAVAGRPAGTAPGTGAAEARDLFADAVPALDDALMQSAGAAHAALQTLASRGRDFTSNDLKDALVGLRKLEEDVAAAALRIAGALGGNLRQDMAGLAAHAQDVGEKAGARVGTLVGDLANRVNESASSGLETVRGTGVRMALLASGVLAGVADALRDRSESKPDR
jgi:hypothetical protein